MVCCLSADSTDDVPRVEVVRGHRLYPSSHRWGDVLLSDARSTSRRVGEARVESALETLLHRVRRLLATHVVGASAVGASLPVPSTLRLLSSVPVLADQVTEVSLPRHEYTAILLRLQDWGSRRLSDRLRGLRRQRGHPPGLVAGRRWRGRWWRRRCLYSQALGPEVTHLPQPPRLGRR
jgi:hypothetical protein